MKYGLIRFEYIDGRSEKFVNIGDPIQTYSIHQIYKRMGIKDDEIVYIGLNELATYKGEYVVLPININLSTNWIVKAIPFSDYIFPVFIGLSYFSSNGLSFEEETYFRQFSPIGCRDEATLSLMRQYKIPAFLMGCVSLSIKEKPLGAKRNKIYLVDVDSSVKEYIPAEMLMDAEIVCESHIINDPKVSDWEKEAEKLLKSYAQEAKMVITSRLHCMAPCLALGIPVIGLVENCSERYSFIDKFIKIYTYNELKNVDWYNFSGVDDDIKDKYISVVSSMIVETGKRYGGISDISQFYENRKKSIYNSFYFEKLRESGFFKDDESKYVVWGTGQIGIGVCQTMKRYYPSIKLVGAIDTYCTGIFFDVEVMKPEEYFFDKKDKILVASYSGEKAIKELLIKKGYIEDVDYICLGTKNG